MNTQQLRINTLKKYQTGEAESQELLTYNDNVFAHSNALESLPHFPLTSELHIASWEQYITEAKTVGVYQTLKSKLVQLQFPIASGISQTQDYQAATRTGKSVEGMKLATGLVLTQPEHLQLFIHPTPAGAIPVLIAGNRDDFVTLIQALTKKNEPSPIPDSMGACIVGGYNNWGRISEYKKKWLKLNPTACSESDWAIEFKSLIGRKELYQDRFIILSPGGYSNVSADSFGLTEEKWLSLSISIRLEHESTHYFTRRLLGSMRNNILDELIADYRGIVAAIGYYRADWFLHFLGLESFPFYRSGGRLENYRGNPPLSDAAFKTLQILVKKAAENLEDFHNKYLKQSQEFAIATIIALTFFTLEELASPEAISLLEAKINQVLGLIYINDNI